MLNVEEMSIITLFDTSSRAAASEGLRFALGAMKDEELKETLELISKNYEDEYERTGYFAAINKGTLFAFAIDGKEAGRFLL